MHSNGFPRIMGLKYSNVPWSGVSGSPIRWLENVNHGTSQLRHDVTKLWHSGHTCNSRVTWRPSYISRLILSRSMTAFIYPLITSRYLLQFTHMSFVVTFRISFSQSYVMEKYKLLCDVLIGCHNSRHDARQIYTYIGDVCVSVNPYTNLDIYGAEYVNQYKGEECDVSP